MAFIDLLNRNTITVGDTKLNGQTAKLDATIMPHVFTVFVGNTPIMGRGDSPKEARMNAEEAANRKAINNTFG